MKLILLKEVEISQTESLVLYIKDYDSPRREFVTWLERKEDKSKSLGHYFDNLEGALQDFLKRLEIYK